MSTHITARRVEGVGSALTAAHTELLDHVQAVRVISGRQLRRLMGAETASAQRRLRELLAQLSSWRVLARLERRVGGVRAGSDSYVYALDVVGQRLLDPTPRRQWRRPWTPSVRILDHALSVSDIYVQFHEATRVGQLEVISFAAEPACWRSFVGPAGGRQTLKPDAHFVIGLPDCEEHRFLEVDRATESLPWIVEKATIYGRYWRTGREDATTGVFPRVLWSTPTEHRREQIIEAITRLPPDDWQLHQVATAEDTVEALLVGEPGGTT